MKRQTLSALCGLLFATLAAAAFGQQIYPTKPVRVVVPFAPGGGADTLARILFGELTRAFGQQFIIDNRGGGSGTIGASLVAKATPDGYAILHDATGFSINPSLFPKLPYNSLQDFMPVFLAGTVPNLLVMHPSVNAATVADIIELAKASREGLNWGSSGNGSVQHMALELFRINAGIRLNHIPYKSGAPALADVIGGHLKFYFSNAAASTNLVKAGTIRAVAHTGRGRLAALPALPPMADTLPGYEAYEWNGVFVPAGTPRRVIDRLNSGLNTVIRQPAIIDRLAALSVQTRANTPADFGAFVAAETEKWGKVVRTANIKAE
ncbi:MAG TPA: tripartite tricarboxylate transporter substrate binding protein [Burkholderiales bacterium]